MEIDGIKPVNGMHPTERRTEPDAKTVRKSGTDDAPEGDTVEVSTSGEVARLAGEVAKIPDVRTEQVEALRESISRGDYNVPAEDIAAALLEELI